MKKAVLSFAIVTLALIQSGAQGYYLEFKMSSPQSGLSGSSKAYSRDGNTRSEISMSSPQMPAPVNRVTLMLKDKPNKAFQLNTTAKTYTEIDLTNMNKTEEDPSEYEITVIGKEKVNGYNATHIKMKRKSQPAEEDAWLSADVPNYKQYFSIKSKYTSAGFYKALQAKGVAGFPVRMMVSERGNTVQIDLVKAEPRSNDAPLFSLEGYHMVGAPAGTPGNTGATSGNAAGSPSDAMKRIQNMTPEERQQFIDQLRQKQQQPTSPQ